MRRNYSSEPIFRVLELDPESAQEAVKKNRDEDDEAGAALDAPTPFPQGFDVSSLEGAQGGEISYRQILKRGQLEYERLKKRKPTVPLEARRFVDMCRVDFVAGSGGNGCTSFYRSKVRRVGPPDGGNGGNGGDIILEACDKTHCFKDIHSKYRGQPGTHGGSNKSAGRHGQDLVIKVPVGTVVYHRVKTQRERERDQEEEELLMQTPPPQAVASSTHDRRGGGGLPGAVASTPAEPGRANRHPGSDATSPRTKRPTGPSRAVGSGGALESGDAAGPVDGEDAAAAADKHAEWLSIPAGRPVGGHVGSPYAGGRGERWQKGDEGDLDGRGGGRGRGVYEDEDEDEDWGGEERSALVQKRRRNSREHIGDMLAELMTPGQRVVIAHGGRGGRGNALLHQKKRSVRARSKGQAGEDEVDMNRELGFPGGAFSAILELKSLADVGLVGAPNAGKSTLLGALSRAMPKTAAYPFTTLRPHLGRVVFDDAFAFTVADIPGLLEGAHENKGLGHSFLRHIERTCVLAYVLDMAAGSQRLGGTRPWVELETLMRELELYRPGICARPALIIANKMDEDGAEYGLWELRAKLRGQRIDLPIVRTSGVLGQGIPKLAQKLREMVEEHRQKIPASSLAGPQEEKNESKPWTPAMED
eukprot:jgi/Mesvir1/28232/Mv04779-RA.1